TGIGRGCSTHGSPVIGRRGPRELAGARRGICFATASTITSRGAGCDKAPDYMAEIVSPKCPACEVTESTTMAYVPAGTFVRVSVDEYPCVSSLHPRAALDEVAHSGKTYTTVLKSVS